MNHGEIKAAKHAMAKNLPGQLVPLLAESAPYQARQLVFAYRLQTDRLLMIDGRLQPLKAGLVVFFACPPGHPEAIVMGAVDYETFAREYGPVDELADVTESEEENACLRRGERS